MAQTEKQNMAGNVKEQETVKAELLARLNATADIVADLTEQLGTIESNLAPEPRPFPENVPLAALHFTSRAQEQRERVFAALDNLTEELRGMHKEAVNATRGVLNLRNSMAWHHVMEKACKMLNQNYNAVEEALQAMAHGAALVATLATFARADTVPEDETPERGKGA